MTGTVQLIGTQIEFEIVSKLDRIRDSGGLKSHCGTQQMVKNCTSEFLLRSKPFASN